MKISAVMQRALCWLFARVYSRWLISQRTMTPLFWGLE